jgi:hypothetical protein
MAFLPAKKAIIIASFPMSLSTLVDSIWTLRARRKGLISGKKLLEMHSLFLCYLLPSSLTITATCSRINWTWDCGRLLAQIWCTERDCTTSCLKAS